MHIIPCRAELVVFERDLNEDVKKQDSFEQRSINSNENFSHSTITSCGAIFFHLQTFTTNSINKFQIF